jgi:hypothetical protein
MAISKLSIGLLLAVALCAQGARADAPARKLTLNFNLASELKKSDLKVLEVPRLFGAIDIDVPDGNPLTAAQLQDAANDYLDKQKKKFADAVKETDKVIAPKVTGGDAKKLEEALSYVNYVGKAFVQSTQVEAKQAVDAKVAEMAKRNKGLLKYKFITAVRLLWHGAKLAVAVARVAVSHGADVAAWHSIVDSAKSIAAVVMEYAKSVDSAKGDVKTAYAALQSQADAVRKKGLIDRIKAEKGPIEQAAKGVDAKLAIFSPKVTQVDQKSKDLAGKLQELLDKVDAAEGSAIPAEKLEAIRGKTMDMIEKIIAMQTTFKALLVFEGGVIDGVASVRNDYTAVAKAINTVQDLYAAVMDFKSKMGEVADLAKQIATLVH